MKLKDILVFRDDLYFEGAVQADWFYASKQLDTVASSFVFHGPSTHAVSKEEVGGRGLMDTASFTLRIAEKMADPESGTPFTMPIAGYGTGKSHLAVTLSALFSGEEFNPSLHETILENLARADARIAERIRPLVRSRHLVLTLNGMRDFNLHYELLRTAEKALRINQVPLDVLARLNRLKETAVNFLDRSFSLLQVQFNSAAKRHEVAAQDEELLQFLVNNLDEQNGTAFQIVNEVYTDFNGHTIRLDEGVSASDVLDTLLQECCGLHGQFDGIVILFDEFGRYLEYVSSNPAAAGDSALQQIFEAVQNADGAIQFISFIQSDIKSYLQRVDKASNISRYIDRYDAGEKIYLSSNLETIFANLLDHPDKASFNDKVIKRLEQEADTWKSIHSNIQKWLPLHGIWTRWEDFQRIILHAIYPMHPLSTFLLCNLTDWLQSRSSLTLLSEKVQSIANIEITDDIALPIIFPVELLKGSLFSELLSAEEQGRQRSQFCILLNNIYRKFDTKLNQNERDVLLANLIIRICRFHFQTQVELKEALCYCCGLLLTDVQTALENLENEYAVLAYDERLICYDFVADSVGATDFRNYLRAAKNRSIFSSSILNQNDILDFADISRTIETDFGAVHGIQTREWGFKQRIEHINNVNPSLLSGCIRQLEDATLPNIEKGLLVWTYCPKETSAKQLDALQSYVSQLPANYAVRVFILDDADNALQDALIEYQILFDMPQADRTKYQRFYDSAMEKACDRVRMQFSDLKAERKIVSQDNVESTKKRLKTYLTDVFEQIYPRAVPFDFEGFTVKTVTGTGYKNYFSIMRWILMDHMNFQLLKAQTTDVRNRVESVLGQNGLYAWKALTKDYKGTKPMQKSANAVFSYLEEVLYDQHVITFSDVISKLTKAPYGLNEYAVFMMVGLFCEVFSNTSKLELDEVRYSTDSWAELIIKDKKYDARRFEKTKLRLIDITETLGQYRRLFQQILSNTDMMRVTDFRAQLKALMNEESVPETLQSDLTLAQMRLDEGARAVRLYEDSMDRLSRDLDTAARSGNAYNALKTCRDATALRYATPASGMYVYNPTQIEDLDNMVHACKVCAEKEFADKWIKHQACSDIEHLSGFKAFAKKAKDLFESFGYTKEAIELQAQVDSEIARINLLMEQQSLLADCKAFLESSQVERGLTMKNLESLQERGGRLYKIFDTFDYNLDRRFRVVQQDMTNRLDEIHKAMNDLKAELAQAWDAIYGIETVDDARRVNQQVSALLTGGLTEKDRDDFESIDKFIRQFLTDISMLMESDETRDSVDTAYKKIVAIYNEESELDFTVLIDNLYADRLAHVEHLEAEWKKEFLEIEISSMDQHQLDQWKRSAQPWPGFLSEATVTEAQKVLQLVEEALSKQRMDYIINLIAQLTKEERKMLLEILVRGDEVL